jgi:hypothetical protein
MNIQDLSGHLKQLVIRSANESSRRVAVEIRDEILTNTAASKGFGDDPYKERLAPATIQLKKERGTYKTRKSTLRDADRSIDRLKVNQPVRGRSIIDFRTTGKGELFFAHHHGTLPPDSFDPFIPNLKKEAYGAKGRPRSIIPLHETSIPRRIHEFAGRILLRGISGEPKITLSSKYDFEDVPF